MTDELWRRSASELAAGIRDRRWKSREVVDAHLERIAAVNDHLNAVVVVLGESAVAAADAADRATAAGDELGPLHGVPITVKENLDCVGSATTQGIPAMAQALPSLDAPVVERMRAAGAIPLGRTNLPEMGLRISTDNPLRGLTRNPWHPDLTAGGSSGGEAAAIATGMSPLGLGNDLGGSVRNPAFCCGIASIKPTQGRVPMGSSLPPEDAPLAIQLMATEGPMARRIADVRLALQILAGQHPRDPRSVSVPFDGGPAPKRAAIVTDIPGDPVIPELVDAVRDAAKQLEAAGYEIEEIAAPEIELVNELWGAMLSGSVALLRGELLPVMSEGAIGLLDQLLERYPPGAMPLDVVAMERARVGRRWAAQFQETPVMIGPVWTDWPFAHSADLDPVTGGDVTLSRLRFITPGNLLGIPGVVVPTGSARGLPLTVQVYADRFRDDLALAAAEVIESESPALTPLDPVTTV